MPVSCVWQLQAVLRGPAWTRLHSASASALPAPVPSSAQRTGRWMEGPHSTHPYSSLTSFELKYVCRHQSQIRSHSQEPGARASTFHLGGYSSDSSRWWIPLTAFTVEGRLPGGCLCPSTWPQALLSSRPSSFPVFVPFSLLIFWDHKILEAHPSYGFFASALESTTDRSPGSFPGERRLGMEIGH